ncbi:MAG: GNAT family N-acetyltransferase [candidate division WOR-3 bacterium]|nr:MAG: GNAT family N-acetyltransferase [candidate division WOR-3 bacterium]
MTRKLTAFEPGHSSAAARLFAESYRTAREQDPLLPPRFEDPQVVEPRIGEMAEKRLGVAALTDGVLTGYLLGRVIPSWRGARTAYVPFWAHAVSGEERGRAMEDMYSALTGGWTSDGCTVHLATVLAQDKEIVDTLFRVGHGMAVYDTMRDLRPVDGPFADVNVRRAGPEDRDTFHSLRAGLVDYLSGPPVFLVTGEDKAEEYYRDWLGDRSKAVWLAYRGAEAAGYLQACRLDEKVLVTDDRTAWVQGAYTRQDLRNQGIAAALLRECVEWAGSEGFERLAVDFEGENVLGRRFWLKHFEPVAVSLVRHLDVRCLGEGIQAAD